MKNWQSDRLTNPLRTDSSINWIHKYFRLSLTGLGETGGLCLVLVDRTVVRVFRPTEVLWPVNRFQLGALIFISLPSLVRPHLALIPALCLLLLLHLRWVLLRLLCPLAEPVRGWASRWLTTVYLFRLVQLRFRRVLRACLYRRSWPGPGGTVSEVPRVLWPGRLIWIYIHVSSYLRRYLKKNCQIHKNIQGGKTYLSKILDYNKRCSLKRGNDNNAWVSHLLVEIIGLF